MKAKRLYGLVKLTGHSRNGPQLVISNPEILVSYV